MLYFEFWYAVGFPWSAQKDGWLQGACKVSITAAWIEYCIPPRLSGSDAMLYELAT